MREEPGQRGQSAVFFDLDRTLLVGASGPVLSSAMRQAGLTDRAFPGESALFELFNRVGETLPSMALARLAVTAAKGRRRDDVRQAARSAAVELAAMVPQFARHVIEEHRSEGRILVMATTTPFDLIEPLAEKLGFDDVVATRYRVGPDGIYDGSLDGPFVWSSGKLSAVRTWARDHDIDLRECFAYSDSVFDVPLLSAVGHPTAVNPDPRLAIVAAARRWPVLHFDVPPGVAKVPVVNMELQSLLLQLARPSFIPFARFDIDGTERIPADSAAIICGNHRSYFDVFAMAVTVAKTGRPVRFLGKKEVFDAPIVGQLATALGGIRVDRGTGSDQPLDAAMDALRAGELVAIMPEGTIPRGPAFFDSELKGRWGAVRLARAADVPLVPVGLWGTEKVWPRAARLPNLVNVVNPPTIRVRVGDPLFVSGDDHDANTRRLMTAIQEQMPLEGRLRREPTEEELRLSYPPGYRGDPESEADRRPGTD
jgi:putative phosphoserine phosphatase/1-acylglycerol-3-phosphate O-acyltransferase